MVTIISQKIVSEGLNFLAIVGDSLLALFGHRHPSITLVFVDSAKLYKQIRMISARSMDVVRIERNKVQGKLWLGSCESGEGFYLFASFEEGYVIS